MELCCSRMGLTRVIMQVYNASNNELVRTNTLVKSAIIQIDATPFRQWYESHVRCPQFVDPLSNLLTLIYPHPVRAACDTQGREGGCRRAS
jgi:ribosomal protein S8E